eukprot:3510117-Amphidinium_carterae.1
MTNSVAYMTSVLPTEPCIIEPRHSENLAESHSVKMELLSKGVEDLCRKVRERDSATESCDCHRRLLRRVGGQFVAGTMTHQARTQTRAKVGWVGMLTTPCPVSLVEKRTAEMGGPLGGTIQNASKSCLQSPKGWG